jgi:hypothetical protein
MEIAISAWAAKRNARSGRTLKQKGLKQSYAIGWLAFGFQE